MRRHAPPHRCGSGSPPRPYHEARTPRRQAEARQRGRGARPPVVKKAAAVFSPWRHCSYDFVHAFLASPKNHCFFPPTPRFHDLLLLTELLSHSHITEIPSRKRRRFPYRATRAAARPCMHACAQLRARRVCWWILPVGNHMHGDGTGTQPPRPAGVQRVRQFSGPVVSSGAGAAAAGGPRASHPTTPVCC